MERVKGLYDSFDSILGTFSTLSKVHEEHKTSTKTFESLAKSESELNLTYVSLVKNLETLTQDYSEMAKLKGDLASQKEKISKVFREKYIALQIDLANSIAEREIFKSKYFDLDKKYFELSEELKKTRIKLKQKSNVLDMDDEKYCRKCMRTYFEKENFNWSCRTHHGKFTGEVYWCCGKTGKDALGCVVEKHSPKEDMAGEKNDELNVRFCSGCKTTGHMIHECPKDPNIRGIREDFREEFKRVEDLMKAKRRKIEIKAEMQERSKEMIQERIEGSDFAKELDSDEEIEEIEGVYFRDLMDIKEELEFDHDYKNFELDSDLIVTKKVFDRRGTDFDFSSII